MLRNYYLLLISICIAGGIHAQELNAKVKVIAPNLTSSDRSVVTQMEKSISDFLNNTKFTGDVYKQEERIKCNVQLTIREDLGNNNFLIDISVGSSRPVFGSNYESSLFTCLDKSNNIAFDPFKPLEFSKESYIDNLSSIMTFYAFIMLAYDYDSFGLDGGQSYFEAAQSIITNLPAGVSKQDGWSNLPSKKTNRFWLLENLTNSRFKVFRSAMYTYHRNGLDLFSTDVEAARNGIVTAIGMISAVEDSYPNSYAMRLFVTAKSAEIIDILKEGKTDEKTKTKTAMAKIDGANSSAYDQLK